jgi:hypothetical protein
VIDYVSAVIGCRLPHSVAVVNLYSRTRRVRNYSSE